MFLVEVGVKVFVKVFVNLFAHHVHGMATLAHKGHEAVSFASGSGHLLIVSDSVVVLNCSCAKACLLVLLLALSFKAMY